MHHHIRRCLHSLIPAILRLLICLVIMLIAGCSGFSPWGGYRQGF